MKQQEADLRQNLRGVIEDVEQVLRNMSDETDESVGKLRAPLRDARQRLGRFERQTAVQVRRARMQAQGYARDNPWKLIGGLAAAAITLAMLSRTRH